MVVAEVTTTHWGVLQDQDGVTGLIQQITHLV